MYELINETNNIKMMALIICTFKYGNIDYCLYSIERDPNEDNIFVSRLVTNSQGYTLDSNIKDDEKGALENIITTFLNKTSLENLKKQGLELTNLELNGINKFNQKKCYITTYNKTLLRECMLHYKLDVPNPNTPLVKIKKSKPINKGNYDNIILLILGIITIIVCILVVIKILSK
ncbi:MAG: hypothetical protein VZS44_05855 [Bacilli bacterium]|nr:hypothetical protein [Bacilli bacterium]